MGATSRAVEPAVTAIVCRNSTSYDHAVGEDEDHGRQAGEGDEPEAVDHRVAPPDRGGEADAQGGDQRAP